MNIYWIINNVSSSLVTLAILWQRPHTNCSQLHLIYQHGTNIFFKIEYTFLLWVTSYDVGILTCYLYNIVGMVGFKFREKFDESLEPKVVLGRQNEKREDADKHYDSM